MITTEYQENEIFENEVRRIARSLWPSAEYGGASKELSREMDGVFETEDCLHLIECTISKTKSKVEHDIKKLIELTKSEKVCPN